MIPRLVSGALRACPGEAVKSYALRGLRERSRPKAASEEAVCTGAWCEVSRYVKIDGVGCWQGLVAERFRAVVSVALGAPYRGRIHVALW